MIESARRSGTAVRDQGENCAQGPKVDCQCGASAQQPAFGRIVPAAVRAFRSPSVLVQQDARAARIIGCGLQPSASEPYIDGLAADSQVLGSFGDRYTWDLRGRARGAAPLASPSKRWWDVPVVSGAVGPDSGGLGTAQVCCACDFRPGEPTLVSGQECLRQPGCGASVPVLGLAETVGGVADLSNQLVAATGVLGRRVGRHRQIVSCRTHPRRGATPELEDAVTTI
jgi:hypothetical protein